MHKYEIHNYLNIPGDREHMKGKIDPIKLN